MSTELDNIKQTLVRISKGESILDTLLEFERTLDSVELFAYKNWILGEIVEGPIIDRYWYKVTLMFPYAMMPDPNGGLRLTKIGARVGFRKGTFKKPVKVEGPQDWRNPKTKQAKMADHPIWLVSIDLPIKFINRGLDNIDDIILKDLMTSTSGVADAYEPDEADMGEMDQEEAMGGDMGGQSPTAGLDAIDQSQFGGA